MRQRCLIIYTQKIVAQMIFIIIMSKLIYCRTTHSQTAFCFYDNLWSTQAVPMFSTRFWLSEEPPGWLADAPLQVTRSSESKHQRALLSDGSSLLNQHPKTEKHLWFSTESRVIFANTITWRERPSVWPILGQALSSHVRRSPCFSDYKGTLTQAPQRLGHSWCSERADEKTELA